MPRSRSPPEREGAERSSHHRSGDRSREERRDRDRDDRGKRRERSQDRYDDERRRDGGSRRERDSDRDRKRHSRHASQDSDEEDSRRRKKEKRSKHRETSEERAERKAAKRRQRNMDPELEEAQAAQRAAAADLMMYSAEDNPFNDANLGQQFKWGKKQEKEKKMGLTPAQAKARDLERRRHAEEELARLNQKRAEREKEQAIREEEEARMARMAESAQMSEWVAKEDDFHLEQSRRRAAIRVRENRAKPIDLLAINLKWADKKLAGKSRYREGGDDETPQGGRVEDDDEDDEAGLEIDLEEPYNIFDNLSLEETEELHEDIKMYLTLETNESNLDFWRSMIVVCDDKLNELRILRDGKAASRLDPSVRADMDEMLAGKSHEELLRLQEEIRNKLQSNEPNLEIENWEHMLKSILVWRAKAKLRDLHEVVLANRIEYLRRKQRDEALRQQQDLVYEMGEDLGRTAEADVDADAAALDAELAAEEAARESRWDPMEMEPKPVVMSSLSYEERRMPVTTMQEERERLIAARRAVLGSAFVPRAQQERTEVVEQGAQVDANVALYQAEAQKALDVEEETFNFDEALTRQSYAWEDKYRPRKPRYFNRVHTGYEWNKYNQTHYDTDNPPPKVVQGYKFNVFYPDLIDKTKAPTYRIIKEPGNDDTVLLKFIAGPPYEDIAFRIVNKEWQFGHKRGFRSSFDRGILQLYFNFARMRYRK